MLPWRSKKSRLSAGPIVEPIVESEHAALRARLRSARELRDFYRELTWIKEVLVTRAASIDRQVIPDPPGVLEEARRALVKLVSEAHDQALVLSELENPGSTISKTIVPIWISDSNVRAATLECAPRAFALLESVIPLVPDTPPDLCGIEHPSDPGSFQLQYRQARSTLSWGIEVLERYRQTVPLEVEIRMDDAWVAVAAAGKHNPLLQEFFSNPSFEVIVFGALMAQRPSLFRRITEVNPALIGLVPSEGVILLPSPKAPKPLAASADDHEVEMWVLSVEDGFGDVCSQMRYAGLRSEDGETAEIQVFDEYLRTIADHPRVWKKLADPSSNLSNNLCDVLTSWPHLTDRVEAISPKIIPAALAAMRSGIDVPARPAPTGRGLDGL